MKINWKLRLKNKYTLTALVSALVLFLNNVAQAFGLDFTEQFEQLEGILMSVITLFTAIGIVVEPTTKGFKDSDIAQTYTEPRDSKNEEQQVDWLSNISKQNIQDISIVPEREELTPKDYDASQPFTDDSDEVYFDVSEYEHDEDLPRGASRLHDDLPLKVGDQHDS